MKQSGRYVPYVPIVVQLSAKYDEDQNKAIPQFMTKNCISISLNSKNFECSTLNIP
jgi:hypothetical protein